MKQITKTNTVFCADCDTLLRKQACWQCVKTMDILASTIPPNKPKGVLSGIVKVRGQVHMFSDYYDEFYEMTPEEALDKVRQFEPDAKLSDFKLVKEEDLDLKKLLHEMRTDDALCIECGNLFREQKCSGCRETMAKVEAAVT
jgi:recombinational DNA repair protein RecR